MALFISAAPSSSYSLCRQGINHFSVFSIMVDYVLACMCFPEKLHECAVMGSHVEPYKAVRFSALIKIFRLSSRSFA